ncbi:MAG: DNA repair protein RecO [Moorellales bacterium]
MALYKTGAVVLHSAPYREADALLLLFSPARGRIRALAKGVRRPKSRLRGGVQPLTRARFLLYAGRALDTVIQCELEEAYPRLHAELERWAQASYLAELLIVTTPEGAESRELYALLTTGLTLLEKERPEAVARFFELRLLAVLGYLPELWACTGCGRRVAGAPVRVGPEGLLCPTCAQSHGGLEIDPRTLAALRFLVAARPESLSRLQLEPPVWAELASVLQFWLGRHLDRPLKSTAVLAGLKPRG